MTLAEQQERREAARRRKLAFAKSDRQNRRLGANVERAVPGAARDNQNQEQP